MTDAVVQESRCAPKPQSDADERAKIRDDLIRRLFAVAISVGAASTLANMKWVDDGRWPLLHEYQQLSILIAAMMATVLSWDGYLWSIKKRPLRTFSRFAIDICLVFVYMFLLMTSKLLVWWLFLHALIYTLYALWDYLSVKDWLPKFYDEPNETTDMSVLDVYWGGLTNRIGVSCGPIITLMWGFYFWALFLGNLTDLRTRIFGTTLFVVLGLWLYRIDKAKPFTTAKRIAVLVALFAANAAYVRWGLLDVTVWRWVGRYIGSASGGP